MAKTITPSINGVSVKNVQLFRDHEGAGIYQADVYIDGKKAGFWSQDSWGGPDNFDFDSSEIVRRAREYYTKHPQVDTVKLYDMKLEDVDFGNLPLEDPENLFEPESIFMGQIVELTEIYKQYKKWSKDGYPVLGQLKFVHGLWPVPQEEGSLAGGRFKEAVEKQFMGYIQKYPYAKVVYFEKPEDFVKTV